MALLVYHKPIPLTTGRSFPERFESLTSTDFGSDRPFSPPVDGSKAFLSSDWPLNDPEVLAALEAAFATGDWGRYHGTQCDALSTELSDYHGVEHALLCASGTIAVELALRGVGVRSSDEVILAAYDFPGNFRAIEAIGARPVLVDVAAGRWTLSADAIEAARTSETTAVIVSHLHGDMAPIREIANRCKQLGIGLVEDACQVIGATIGDRRAGTYGDVGVLSFGGSKLITAGRGGAILTDQAAVAQRARISNDRGNEAYPLSELQAAVLRPQLARLNERNDTRRRNARLLLDAIQDVMQLKSPAMGCDDVQPGFYKLGWQLLGPDAQGRREDFIQSCAVQGIPTGSGFRGFHRRSSRRCRRVGELTHSRVAAESTILLHHPALIGDSEHIVRLAKLIRQTAEMITRN